MTKSRKTLWQKEKLFILSNFFFCHYVFKKPSAAEASESVYMRERVNSFSDIGIIPRFCGRQLFTPFPHATNLQQTTLKISWQKHGKPL